MTCPQILTNLCGGRGFVGNSWENKTTPRRCANTVDPGGLADYKGVDW